MAISKDVLDPGLNDVDAAQFLGLSAKTLRNWRFLGIGPDYDRFGRTIRYRLSKLHEFREKHSVVPVNTRDDLDFISKTFKTEKSRGLTKKQKKKFPWEHDYRRPK